MFIKRVVLRVCVYIRKEIRPSEKGYPVGSTAASQQGDTGKRRSQRKRDVDIFDVHRNPKPRAEGNTSAHCCNLTFIMDKINKGHV